LLSPSAATRNGLTEIGLPLETHNQHGTVGNGAVTCKSTIVLSDYEVLVWGFESISEVKPSHDVPCLLESYKFGKQQSARGDLQNLLLVNTFSSQ
jgi:hypothetical protein